MPLIVTVGAPKAKQLICDAKLGFWYANPKQGPIKCGAPLIKERRYTFYSMGYSGPDCNVKKMSEINICRPMSGLWSQVENYGSKGSHFPSGPDSSIKSIQCCAYTTIRNKEGSDYDEEGGRGSVEGELRE